ncbi:MAG: YggT family protein [Deltaproteobacteria bacterium]|jgi:YggT family protein
MFVIGNFLKALATIIDIALGAYVWLIIGRVIISWVNADPYNPIVRFLYGATEPLLAPIRRRLPFFGGLDLSPMVLILAIIFLQQFLVPTLQRMAMALG